MENINEDKLNIEKMMLVQKSLAIMVKEKRTNNRKSKKGIRGKRQGNRQIKRYE